MRVPRVRFTVRGYMIAVAVSTAVIVLGLQITSLARSRRAYLENAGQHAVHEEIEQERLSIIAQLRSEGLMDDPSIPIAEKVSTIEELTTELPTVGNEGLMDDPSVPIAEKLTSIENQSRSVLKWHSDMKRKWQRAADRPWEHVSTAPDVDSYYKYTNH
jgi:hypothetical protein